MSKHRRRTFLIKTGLQLRYMGIIVTTMLTVACCVGWIIYQTSWSRIVEAPDLTIDKLGEIFDSVNHTLVQWTALFLLIIAAISIFVSHKIAGPVYKLERTAKILASGDLTASVRLRHGDELRDLEEAFNSMAEALRNMVSKDREVIERLVHAGSRLNETLKKKKLDPAEIEGVTKELYKVIEELQLVTAGFKIDKNLIPGQPTEPMVNQNVSIPR